MNEHELIGDFKKLSANFDVLILDQSASSVSGANGILTNIQDFVKANSDLRFGLIGLGANDDEPEVWKQRSSNSWAFSLRRNRFANILPDSLQLVSGLIRKRFDLSGLHIMSHRIEIGFYVSALGHAGQLTQFIHNDSQGLLGVNSESAWRNLPLLYRKLERTVLTKARKVVVFNRLDFGRISAVTANAQLFLNWFDSAVFCNAVTSRGEAGEPLRLAFIGRLEQQKDPLLALHAFENVLQKTPATLTFAGDGTLRTQLMKQAHLKGILDSINFLGNVTKHEVANLVRMSDLVLMTSHFEGSPMVLVESLALGIPVVATQESDPDGLILENLNGIKTKGRNPETLADLAIASTKIDSSQCVKSVTARSSTVMIPNLRKYLDF
jgi:glycosyltransferase involved in cell wall biosynthesis